MYVREFGSKQSKCIVFIHGGGVSGWMWDKQIEDLQSDFYCLVPDLPGQGKSRGITPFSIKDSAQQISALIENKVAGGKAHLIGHSIGAQIALQLLADSPEVIDRAIVSSALARPLHGMINLIKPTLRLTIPLTRHEWFARLQAKTLSIPNEMFDSYFDDSKTITAEILEQLLIENASFSLPQGLAHCPVPTLVLVGQRERRIMRHSAKDILAAIPNSKGYIVQGVGHGFNFDAPERFNQLLRAWFTDRWNPSEELKAIY